MQKTTTIRIDDALKNEASSMLEALGLNFNTFVTMATKQLVTQRRIPFSLNVPPSFIPNETTRRAMVEAEARELGIIPDDSPTFSNVDDLIVSLEQD